MALRLVEIVLPLGKVEQAEALFEEVPHQGLWQEGLGDNLILTRILVPAEHTEPLLDRLDKFFSGLDSFKALLLPVEAAIPRKKGEPAAAEEKEREGEAAGRLSRYELYDELSEERLTWTFVILCILSTVAAVIGLIRGNEAVIIGAMVLAPLMKPNMALCLGLTLGDLGLASKAAVTNTGGLATVILLSGAIGLIIKPDPGLSEIATRSQVNWADLVLGLVSGAAGALAFTTGLSEALIGVMVAVALLPPLVTFGLLAGSHSWHHALGALMLVLANLVCINLAGVFTFWSKGIRPTSWWEAERARRATRTAVIILGVLLLALGTIIYLVTW